MTTYFKGFRLNSHFKKKTILEKKSVILLQMLSSLRKNDQNYWNLTQNVSNWSFYSPTTAKLIHVKLKTLIFLNLIFNKISLYRISERLLYNFISSGLICKRWFNLPSGQFFTVFSRSLSLISHKMTISLYIE